VINDKIDNEGVVKCDLSCSDPEFPTSLNLNAG